MCTTQSPVSPQQRTVVMEVSPNDAHSVYIHIFCDKFEAILLRSRCVHCAPSGIPGADVRERRGICCRNLSDRLVYT